jgi:hypothetical protein
MKLIKYNSKKGIVNLFSDYILQKIDRSLNSVIQITDLNNFFIINGITESQVLLDISKIKDEFISEYSGLLKDSGYSENINTMDLIQYGKSFIEGDNRHLWTTFYNSTRPIYHTEVMMSNLSNKEIQSIDYSNGLVYEIDGFITEYKAQYSKFIIILTGGDSDFLAKRLKNTIFANSNFLLESLNQTFQYRIKND